MLTDEELMMKDEEVMIDDELEDLKYAINRKLIIACKEGNIELAKALIDLDADVSFNDIFRQHYTALMEASYHGHKEVVELLIAAGVDVNAKHEYNITALISAVMRGHKEIVELLIAAGADLNVKSRYHDQALRIAASKGYREIVELLIEAGADINAKTDMNTTPLHWAALYGSKEIVELLVEAGADVNVKDNLGDTALSVAETNKHNSVIEYLKQHIRTTIDEIVIPKTTKLKRDLYYSGESCRALDFNYKGRMIKIHPKDGDVITADESLDAVRVTITFGKEKGAK